MTIIQLKRFLLNHIAEAVEVPAISCNDYTRRQMWEFYNEMTNREIMKGNHKMIIAETLERKILQDFGGERVKK